MADGSVIIEVGAKDTGVEETLEKVEKGAEDTGKKLDDLGDSGKEAGKGLDMADVAAGNLVSDGLLSLLGSLKDTVLGFTALADETREFREDMAKLQTAFTDGGHTAETAQSAYKGFYAILGESDRSVEAVNHLAELTTNEKEVAQWSTIAAGVTAKFGDSLPIEGLTEAANETAKVGAVTGAVADALNWAGISEDEFNKKLKKCNSEQERATLITNTLNGLYSDAAAEYNELTASTQAARLATAEMEEAQANIGATIEPLTTAWTNMKAQAFEAMLPIVQGLVNAFTNINKWMDENPGKAEIIKGVLIGLATAFGVLAVAMSIGPIINIVTTAFANLNLTMLMNPITLVIAAVAALVAAFIYLWNNCDAFREFWINLWNKIVEIITPVWDEIKGIFAAAWVHIKAIWDTVKPYFEMIWNNIKIIFSVVKDVLASYFKMAWENIKIVWNTVVSYFKTIWENIKLIFGVVKDVLSGNFSDAWTKIKQIFANWGQFFQGLFDNVKKIFGNIGDTFKEVGQAIVDGIKKGITAGWKKLTDFVGNLANKLFGKAKDELEINSPSKKFEWIGKMLMDGLSEGITGHTNEVLADIETMGSEMVDTMSKQSAETIKNLENEIDTITKTRENAYKNEIKSLEKQIKALSEQETKGNKDTINAKKKALQKELDILKEKREAEQERLAEQKENLQKELQLEKEKERNLLKYAETFKKQMEKFKSTEEKYAQDGARIYEQLDKDINAAREKYETSFMSRLNAIKNELNLFEKAEKGDAVSGKELTNNLKSQIDLMTDYKKVLADLENKNVDAAFIEEMKKQGLKALPELEAINKMSEKELNAYVDLWAQKDVLAGEITEIEFSETAKELDNEISELEKTADADFAKLRSEYRNELILLADEIAVGMTESGDAGLAALGEQISEYTNAGKDLMDGVVKGIEEGESDVINSVVNSIRNAINEAKAAAGIHSPSKVMENEVGGNLALGTVEGWKNKISALNNTMATGILSAINRARATVNAETGRFAAHGASDNGMSDLARAVGMQTAGINSLASMYKNGGNSNKPIVIELDKRVVGQVFGNVIDTDKNRIGAKMATGGAY